MTNDEGICDGSIRPASRSGGERDEFGEGAEPAVGRLIHAAKLEAPPNRAAEESASPTRHVLGFGRVFSPKTLDSWLGKWSVLGSDAKNSHLQR
jgi:hypothetical protein